MSISDDLRSITHAHVEAAVVDIESGLGAAGFGPSRDWDLLLHEKRYPPKQVIGTAARHAVGRELAPHEFQGGDGADGANRVLKELGYEVVPKPAPEVSAASEIDFAGLVSASSQPDSSISHNLAVWRAVVGGTEMALAEPIAFDPREDYWHRPERRFLVAYLSRRWPKWPSGAEKEELLARFALDLSQRMERLRAEQLMTHTGIDYDEGGGIEAVLAPIRSEIQAIGSVDDWDRLKASSDPSPTARQSLQLFLDAVVRDGFSEHERSLSKVILWWPILGASSLEDLERKQRFFWAYRHALMSSNAYTHAGAQFFGPIIGNTPTKPFLNTLRQWRDGALPETAPMMGMGKDDEEPANRSHTNIAREVWGFLNLHRAPFYNNQVQAYAREGETPEAAVLGIGERCHEWLAANPGPRKELAERLEALVRTARRSGKSPFAQARRWRLGKGSAFDEQLRAGLEEAAVERLRLLSEEDRAAVLLHLALDAERRANRPQPTALGESTEEYTAEAPTAGGAPVGLRSAERVWIYSPGHNANHWSFDREHGVASIGWDIGNLQNYADEAELFAALQAARDDDTRPVIASRTCWDFSHEIQVGDPIVARKGRSRILGIGVVERTYFWVEGEEFSSRVGVRWIWTGEHLIADKRSLAIKTLVESSRRKRLLQELDGLLRQAEPLADVLTPQDEEDEAGAEVYTRDNALADLFIPDAVVDQMVSLLQRRKNLILQGPPGVGKTFVAKRLAYLLMGEKAEDRVVTVQFHQAYTYEQFVRGYRPTGDGGFELASGPLFEMAEKAQGDPDNVYALVIDEINRGNLSKILGEAMMLLEADKRSRDWALQLAYSSGTEDEDEEPFYLPDNLYIIGTMNTADRSLAVVDYALRRRFVFVDLRPGFEEPRFADHLSELAPAVVAKIRGRMRMLNDLVLADPNLGRGFEVGHSYFARGDTKVPAPWGDDADAWLESIFKFEIVPLLREYWFDDPAKLSQAEAILEVAAE